jgi:hypothetical protein
MVSVSDIMSRFGEKPAQAARAVADKIGADFQAVRMWPIRGRVPVEWILPFTELCRNEGMTDVTIELVTRISAERARASDRQAAAE